MVFKMNHLGQLELGKCAEKGATQRAIFLFCHAGTYCSGKAGTVMREMQRLRAGMK